MQPPESSLPPVLPPRREIGDAYRVQVVPTMPKPPTEAVKNLLAGHVVIIEGGIAQGKTTLIRVLATCLRQQFGIKTQCYLEALEDFMKYQKPLPADANEADVAAFTEGRKAAAVRLQFSMLHRRAEVIKSAVAYARNGAVAIVDRGPWGDISFMAHTFRAYAVSEAEEIKYVIQLITRYRRILSGAESVLLRVDAPVSVTHQRWLEREKGCPTKYSQQYMQSIEDCHDACAEAWGPYVVYDNSNVPYVRPTSPFDGDGQQRHSHGYPEEYAVYSLIGEMCHMISQSEQHSPPEGGY
jgi:deoxyadenosine/deoxycytidine kinase